FNSNKSFPTARINKDTFPYASDKMVGKPVLATYGRHERGELQTPDFNMNPVTFPNGKRFLAFSAWDAVNLYLTVDLDPAQVTTALGYAYTSYPQGLTRLLFIQIYAQDNQSDVK